MSRHVPESQANSLAVRGLAGGALVLGALLYVGWSFYDSGLKSPDTESEFTAAAAPSFGGSSVPVAADRAK